jgi:hypothetical protein
MSYLNPCEYANQFRAELQADLCLQQNLSCPKCVITYVDGEREDCCFYARGGVLNCVFDFTMPIKMEEVVGEWKDAVLKMCRREQGPALEAKWRSRLFTNP